MQGRTYDNNKSVAAKYQDKWSYDYDHLNIATLKITLLSIAALVFMVTSLYLTLNCEMITYHHFKIKNFQP